MTATSHEQALRFADARQQDAYWRRSFRREHYVRPGLDYEDYAPAYCVGYAGHAQYGGSFEEAERSLCANWERIKGGSRLAPADAMQAMRAAWDRMEQGEHARRRSAPPWDVVFQTVTAAVR